MKISILPSAIVDIVRIRCFYEGLEIGLGILQGLTPWR